MLKREQFDYEIDEMVRQGNEDDPPPSDMEDAQNQLDAKHEAGQDSGVDDTAAARLEPMTGSAATNKLANQAADTLKLTTAGTANQTLCCVWHVLPQLMSRKRTTQTHNL
eukprot:jgi/Ulvmu1/5158/UM021_0175.1